MPLSLDMSRALRTRAELAGLVDAIARAPATEQETDYVEWKSSLDLRGSREHRFEAAKHIIGFGNRQPSHAAGTFEGCSYLVLGVEPQSVTGVPVEDVANLESWLGPYVGTDGPRWIASYVEYGGNDVLVVTVEAPRWGDYPFTLARGHGDFEPGQIFIRRAGKTVKPNQAEVRMLTERAARAASRIALNVELRRDVTLKSFESRQDERGQWIARERQRLSAPLRKKRPEPAPSFVPRVSLPEDLRDREEYISEVERYLARAEERWIALAFSGAVRRRLAPVPLVIRNATDQNFAGVEVVVKLPEKITPFFDPNGPFAMLKPPRPPDEWGTHSVASLGRVEPATSPIETRGEIRKRDEHFEVRFSPVQVRPQQVHDMPPLFLGIPHAVAPETVTVSWVATSTSAEGSVSGDLELPLASDPVSATDLVSAAEAATS